MEISSVLLLLGVFLLVAAFVGWPFLQTANRLAAGDRTRSALLAERERLLSVLRELDFDYSLGKIPEEDYPLQRAELIQRGAEVMRKLDELPAVDIPATVAHPEKRAAPTDDDIEDLITKRRTGRKEKTGGFCPNCGKAVLASDRFCPGCGKILK
jgi:zinc-ribbon domain